MCILNVHPILQVIIITLYRATVKNISTSTQNVSGQLSIIPTIKFVKWTKCGCKDLTFMHWDGQCLRYCWSFPPHPPPLTLFLPPSVPLFTDPCHFWSRCGQHVHHIPSAAAKQPHNEKCLHVSSVSQTLFETKSPYRTCILFAVLIGGKINVLCISTVLLKQDKNHTNKSEAVAIEWIV